MTIPAISEIIDGIVSTLQEIDARIYAGIVSSPEPPAIIVYPKAPWDIAVTFDGGIDLDITVLCVASTNVLDGSQRRVNDWLSPGRPESIIDLLQGNPTLDGLVGSAVATSVDTYSLDADPSSARYVLAALTVNVKK